jgi:hypothetical protein
MVGTYSFRASRRYRCEAHDQASMHPLLLVDGQTRSNSVVPTKSGISASSRSDDPNGRSWRNPRFQGTTGQDLSEMATFRPCVKLRVADNPEFLNDEVRVSR